MEKIISDLRFESLGKDRLMILVDLENGSERSIADFEYKDHEKAPYEEVYNECLEVAHDLGYKLEGECDE